jgi:superfamily I DNA and RNA helicase
MKTFSDDFYYLAQTSKKVPYPSYDYIFCDEVQDFNMC